jgi:hypothetical protein
VLRDQQSAGEQLLPPREQRAAASQPKPKPKAHRVRQSAPR